MPAFGHYHNILDRQRQGSGGIMVKRVLIYEAVPCHNSARADFNDMPQPIRGISLVANLLKTYHPYMTSDCAIVFSFFNSIEVDASYS
jgi:hypothetical protein